MFASRTLPVGDVSLLFDESAALPAETTRTELCDDAHSAVLGGTYY
jgi:hypothetical protein